MDARSLWRSRAAASDEYLRWERALYERVFPVLKEYEWLPCLSVVDGRPSRLAVLLCGAARSGQPARQLRT
jgi:hypothetical protein